MLATAQRNKTLGDESAVEAFKRHHVGDRSEGNEMQERQQVGLATRTSPEVATAQFARDCDQCDENKADRSQMAKSGQIVGAVGIDDRHRVGKFLVSLMVVDNHRIEAKFFCLGEWFEARNATIDRDQQLHAAFGKRPDGVDIRSVAFEDPVRDVDDRIQTAMAEIAAKQC